MRKKTNKMLVLFCSLFVLLSIYLVLPSTLGYGTDYGTNLSTAEEIDDGVRYEEIFAGNESVYYKFFCHVEANVTVDIAFNMSDFNLSLYVLVNSTPNSGIADYSNATGNDYQNCSITANLTGYYYINVSTNHTLNWNFTLNLSIVGGRIIFSPWIPGFEVIFIVFGLILSVGIMYRLKFAKRITGESNGRY